MKTIYKYMLEFSDEQTVKMPLGAVILCCQSQGGLPMLWAEVNPESRTIVNYTILIIPTGGDLPPSGVQYIGTVQTGACVWHIYEKLP